MLSRVSPAILSPSTRKSTEFPPKPCMFRDTCWSIEYENSRPGSSVSSSSPMCTTSARAISSAEMTRVMMGTSLSGLGVRVAVTTTVSSSSCDSRSTKSSPYEPCGSLIRRRWLSYPTADATRTIRFCPVCGISKP